MLIQFLKDIGVEKHLSGARRISWMQQTLVSIRRFRCKLLADIVILFVGLEV
jgi:hypothetical protein